MDIIDRHFRQITVHKLHHLWIVIIRANDRDSVKIAVLAVLIIRHLSFFKRSI